MKHIPSKPTPEQPLTNVLLVTVQMLCVIGKEKWPDEMSISLRAYEKAKTMQGKDRHPTADSLLDVV